MTTTLNFGIVAGLTAAEQQQLSDLAEAYTYHQSRNAIKDKYYEGHVTLRDVNLGIALPLGLRGLEVGCSWGQKAVDVLAARSMFVGFVGTGGSLNYGGWSDLQCDQLLEACRTSTDHEAALNALCRYLQTQSPILPLCFETVSALYESDVVEGLTPTAAEPFYDLSSCIIHLKAS